jgi:hypothetical protein
MLDEVSDDPRALIRIEEISPLALQSRCEFLINVIALLAVSFKYFAFPWWLYFYVFFTHRQVTVWIHEKGLCGSQPQSLFKDFTRCQCRPCVRGIDVV